MTTATPTKPAADSAANEPGWKPELREIPTDRITVGGNVRADVGDVDELAASIKAHGVLSPISVEEVGVAADGGPRYVLVYGQRRLAASRAAGVKTIPAIVGVGSLSDRNRTVAQLIENLQRADLNALDTAKAYRALLDEGLTQRQLAATLGIAQPTIANTLAVLKQPEPIQRAIAAGELTRSHVEVLARLPEDERQEVARRVVEHKMSTRQLEEEIDLAAKRQRAADAERDRLATLIPQVAAKVPDVLKKAKLDPKAITLVVPDSALRARLAADGLTVAEVPTPTPVNLYGTGAQVDPCASSVRLLRWYPAWGANYPPQLEVVCVDDRAHRAERDAAVKAAQAKRDAEWKAQQEKERAAEAAASAKERAERRTARAPLVAQLAADPELRSRVLLSLVVTDAVEYDDAREELGLDFGDEVWAAVQGLPFADVERLVLDALAAWVELDRDVAADLAARRSGEKRAARKAAKAKS